MLTFTSKPKSTLSWETLKLASDTATATKRESKSWLEWEPVMDFDEGLKLNIAWFEDKWDLIQGAASYVPGSSAAVRGTVTDK